MTFCFSPHYLLVVIYKCNLLLLICCCFVDVIIIVVLFCKCYFVCILFSGSMCFVLGQYLVQACLLCCSFPRGKLIINK